MTKAPGILISALLLLVVGAASAVLASTQLELTPDETPIRFTERAPENGTPQAAMLNLVLFREEGNTEEAATLISKECPDWLRSAMLSPNGSMKKDTLSYQLREFEPGKALVSVDYNTEDGTFKGWTRKVILEDGRWVVR